MPPMSKDIARLGTALKLPEFVSQYATKNKPAAVAKLEKKLRKKALYDKYANCITTYNSMAIFAASNQSLIRYNFAHQWETLSKKLCESRIPTSLFLKDPLDNRIFRSIMKSNFLSDNVQYYCMFRELGGIDHLQELLELAASNETALTLHAVALREKPHKASMAATIAYLNKILVDSENLYKGLTYEKLLKIAQASEPEPTLAKKILFELADNKLSRPKRVCNDTWIVFTQKKKKK